MGHLTPQVRTVLETETPTNKKLKQSCVILPHLVYQGVIKVEWEWLIKTYLSLRSKGLPIVLTRLIVKSAGLCQQSFCFVILRNFSNFAASILLTSWFSSFRDSHLVHYRCHDPITDDIQCSVFISLLQMDLPLSKHIITIS